MIRPATAADLPAAAALYEAVLDRELADGVIYTNWKKGKYPTPDTVRAAFDAGTLFVGVREDGQLWGAVNLNRCQPEEYDAIPWSLPAEPDAVGVIHTLAIHPDCAGQGLARRLIAFCEDRCRRSGCAVMRLDTWEGNDPANHLYTALDYRLAGSAEFLFQGCIRETLNCYEKAL